MSGLGAGERGYPDRPSAPITLTLTLSHRGRGVRPAPGIPCEHRCACSRPLTLCEGDEDCYASSTGSLVWFTSSRK